MRGTTVREMLDESDESSGLDVLDFLETALDEATTILTQAADQRSALLDLAALARSARHELGVQHMTIEELFAFADRDPITAGEIRALTRRAIRKEDDDDGT